LYDNNNDDALLNFDERAVDVDALNNRLLTQSLYDIRLPSAPSVRRPDGDTPALPSHARTASVDMPNGKAVTPARPPPPNITVQRRDNLAPVWHVMV
jgi:hypothetical protein